MKEDQRGKVIDFISKHDRFPRNTQNDVCFTELGCEGLIDWADLTPGGEISKEGEWIAPSGSLLSVFTPEEVVAMVNRFLYQMEYQRTIHRQRERDKSEELAPIKAKVRELFHTSWTKATEDQIRVAADRVNRERMLRELP